MRLCCMRSCTPGKGEAGEGHPMVPSSQTEPCGANIMQTNPCREKSIEIKASEGSCCEREESRCDEQIDWMGATVGRGPPMDPRITITPDSEHMRDHRGAGMKQRLDVTEGQ